MKPRVVILSAFLSPLRSGAEACAEEVPLRLTEDFDCVIITARMRRGLPRKDMLPGKVPVVRVGFGCTFDKWLYPFLAAWEARKQKPTIIHGILETFAGLALHFCRYTCPQARRLLTLQTTNRSFLKKLVLLSPHRVTAISKHLAGIANDLGRKDVIVIPNGIDYEAFRAACARHAKVPGRILFIGRLEKMKGVDLLLAAFAQLKKVTLPMKLHIVGDGSQRAVLESLARGFGIADRVRFLGRLDGALLLKEYAEAEIFCGLSRSEALGNVFLEAQAAGCAVVASDVDGIPEIVEDSVSGVLVEAKDTDAASKAMADLLGDAEQRKRFAEAGIERAKEYDWYVIAKRYTEQYSSSGISALRP